MSTMSTTIKTTKTKLPAAMPTMRPRGFAEAPDVPLLDCVEVLDGHAHPRVRQDEITWDSRDVMLVNRASSCLRARAERRSSSWRVAFSAQYTSMNMASDEQLMV
jgi:hypothetical protein